MWRIFQWSHKNAALVAGIVLLLTLGLGSQLPKLQIKVSSEELIPQDSPARAAYAAVRDQFGSDEVSVVYAESEDLFTPQTLGALQTLGKALNKLPQVERIESLFTVSNVRGESGWIDTGALLDTVPSTQAALDEKLAQALANPIIKGQLISENGQATVLTLYLKDADMLAREAEEKVRALEKRLSSLPETSTQRREALQAERTRWQAYMQPEKFAETFTTQVQAHMDEAARDVNFDAFFQMGGPSVQIQLKQAIIEDQRMLLPLAMLVLVVLIGFLLRSIQGALVPLIGAALATTWTLGTMAMLGVPVNMLSSIVPALILVIGATEDVHLLIEYRKALAKGHRGGAATLYVGNRLGLTLLLTGITTVLGFAAAGLTDLKIMQDFGATAALGMFARFLVSVFFVPAYLRLMGRFMQPKLKPEAISAAMQSGAESSATSGLIPKLCLSQRFANWVIDTFVPRPWLTLGTFAVIALPCIYFGTKIELSNDLVRFLRPSSQLVQDIERVHANLAGTKVIYLTLKGQPGDFREAANLQRMEGIAKAVRKLQGVDTVTSLADTLALVNREMFEGGANYHAVPARDSLVAQYLLFFHPRKLAPYVTGDYAQANMVIRTGVHDSAQINAMLGEIRSLLNSGEFGPVFYTLTGKSVMVANSVQQLAAGQVASINFMVGILFIIIAVLFVSFRAAALTVIANLFAVAVLFGVMGLLGISLNVGTCMVAAITIGIGIDDTLHLMVHYNRELKHLKDELPALRQAIIAEFHPVMATSIGLAAGFLILGASSFVPVMQFGLLSAGIIFVAVLADLILMPVLLSTTRLITLWDLVGLQVRKTLREESPLFQGMNTMQAKRLILASNVQEYPAGEKVIAAGDMGEEMYVILDGELDVVLPPNEVYPQPKHVARLGMGEVFGEIGLVAKTERTADVTARSHAKVLVYNWEGLGKLRRYAPYLASQLMLNVSKILCFRLAGTEGREPTGAPFETKTPITASTDAPNTPNTLPANKGNAPSA